MKLKRIISMIAILFAVCCLASCASTGDNGSTGGTGDTGDTGGAGDSGDSGDTGDTGGTEDSGDSGNTENDKIQYTITVVMPDGTPATSDKLGASLAVQLCTVESCRLPKALDASGKAVIEDVDDVFYVHLNGLPDAYTFDSSVSVSKETPTITVPLLPISTYTQTGTRDDKIVLTNTGYYNVSLNELSSQVYFSFTPSEAGTYSFQSMVNLFANAAIVNGANLYVPQCDPLFYTFTETNGTPTLVDSADNISDSNVNFLYEKALEANTTYYFAIRLQLTSDLNTNAMNTWPLSFAFSINRK